MTVGSPGQHGPISLPLAEFIRDEMTRRGLTLEGVARGLQQSGGREEYSRASKQLVSEWRSGKVVPGPLHRRLIAKFFNVPIELIAAKAEEQRRVQGSASVAHPTNDYEVKVLQAGYSIWIGPTQQRADGTITLLKGPRQIVVDTGGPWNRQRLPGLLRRESVLPSDVSFVVCTHGHSDHVGNINLFPNATLLLSYDVCKGDVYTFHDFAHGQSYRIDDAVEVIPTPGHTKDDISVVVETCDATFAIVGDLFENEADRDNEDLWRSFSEYPTEQEISRARILEVADFIVPGHGDLFRVRGTS
jgi:glyoxylase-like metal-dependent hydrolase (beta-lactamase superfamily II)